MSLFVLTHPKTVTSCNCGGSFRIYLINFGSIKQLYIDIEKLE